MHVSLALLLSAALPAQSAPLPNLDLAAGNLKHWEGEGFSVINEPLVGVSSADDGRAKRTGVLYRTFVLPRDAGAITFRAAAVRPEGVEPGAALEVVLEGAERKMAPRYIRTDKGLQSAPKLLPPVKGKPREYVWNVEGFGGQTVRICAFDQDERPGCHVVCGGFTILSRDDHNGREFGDLMLRLCRENSLPPVTRFDSKRFLAVANADEPFVERQLLYCETLYDLFFDHFRAKRFGVREPAGRLMVAVFDTPVGFESYIGRRMPNAVTGIYHTPSNRLVVYDYAKNRSFEETKRLARAEARRINSDLDRRRYIDTLNRRASEFRTEANIGTVMHEVAHQLSFNCGMLNREADVPFWVAEGLATYCEATENGAWQGIGEPNPERIQALAPAVHGQAPFIKLRDLAERDDWMRDTRTALMAYAQGWALFKMLMEERPAQLRRFLETNFSRRTRDHRAADFATAFGVEVDRLELRFLEFVKEQVERHTPVRR